MTPEQARTLANDLALVHYPSANPEQVQAIHAELHQYPAQVAEDAIRRYARMHPDFLRVEPLLAAIAEAAAAQVNPIQQRREAMEVEQAAWEAQDREVDEVVGRLSDEAFAEWLARAKEGSCHGEWFWKRGRRSRGVRHAVHEAMQRQEKFQRAAGRSA